MSSCSRQSIANRWHSILTVTVASIACWSAAPSAPAQKSESPTVMASLSVSTIQPEFMLTSVREQPDRPAPRVAERTDWPLPCSTASRRTPRRGKNLSRNFGQSNGVRRPSNARSKPPNTASTRPCLPSIASSRASETTPTSNLNRAPSAPNAPNSEEGFLNNPAKNPHLKNPALKPRTGPGPVLVPPFPAPGRGGVGAPFLPPPSSPLCLSNSKRILLRWPASHGGRDVTVSGNDRRRGGAHRVLQRREPLHRRATRA